MSFSRVAILLLLATLAAMLPHALMQDWSGTEGRRVQIAMEMARSGQWLVPTLFGEPTFAKPPLHYWILCGANAVFGDGYLAMRAPSILAVWLLSLLAFGLHRRAFSEAAAWIAALGVVASPLVVAHFATAEIDPIFACLTAASLWLLAFGVAREKWLALVAAGVLSGLALLQKGPPFLLFAVGAWLVWLRRRGLRGFLVYAVPMCALPGAWIALVMSSPVAIDEAAATANTETLGRLVGYDLEHYLKELLEIPLLFVRAVLVQAPLVFWCFWEHRSKRDARMGPEDLTLRMCSGAAVLAVALLALFPDKPTRYLLPNVPLFTFAVAPAVAHYALRASKLGHVATGSIRAIGIVGALLLIALPWIPSPIPPRTPVLAVVAALVPLWVRTPRAMIAMCLWLPVLAGWTALADWRDRHVVSPRAVAVHGARLDHELRRLGATETTIEAYGHVHGGLLLSTGLLPSGQENVRRVPKSRFLLIEARGSTQLPPRDDYVERLRLCTGREVFVVEERRDGR